MRKQTATFLALCWDRLRMADNLWNSEQEFIDWAANENEVDARAFNTYLTKLDDSEIWSSENARIVNIMEDTDWNLIQSDAIAFKEE